MQNGLTKHAFQEEKKKEVLVFLKEETIVGFVIVEISEDGIGETPLTGIDPNFQGLGIYATIGYAHWAWFKQRNVKYMRASTQLTNFIQHISLGRFGYQPTHAVYTLHKWFD